MTEIPKKISVGCGLGLIGGVASIICLAVFYTSEPDTLLNMALYMLIACLFFGIAGAFTKTGQWGWRMITFMALLTIGLIAMFTVCKYFDVYAGIILAAIALLIVAVVSFPSSKKWLSRI